MKKKFPLILLSMFVGGCVAQAVPALAHVAEATITMVIIDKKSGDSRTVECIPLNTPAPEGPTYH